jgi:hypothetical protein
MVIRWSLTMDIFMWGGSPYEKKVRQLMVNNSTNINKTNYHLKSLNTKRPRQMTCDIDNLSLEQAEKCSMVKLVMGSQHPLLIIGYPMAIQKCTDLNKQYKICTGLLSLKNPHTSIIGYPIIKRGCWDPITSLTMLHFSACSKLRLSMSHVICRGLFVFNDLRW